MSKRSRSTRPLGKPSDSYRIGTLEGRRVAFLARHNRNHTILPSELNFRANIHGFKQLGVEWILSASAVGSLKEELHPLDIVLARSVLRPNEGTDFHVLRQRIVAHVSFGDPLCHVLADVIEVSGEDAGCPHQARRHLRLYGRAAVLDEGGIRTRIAAGVWI